MAGDRGTSYRHSRSGVSPLSPEEGTVEGRWLGDQESWVLSALPRVCMTRQICSGPQFFHPWNGENRFVRFTALFPLHKQGTDSAKQILRGWKYKACDPGGSSETL